jgi:hypothetical protein
MGEESGAPLPRSAEMPTAVKPTASLAVDESLRQPRKEVPYHTEGESKDTQWHSGSRRYLSPSPSPSGRLSLESRQSVSWPETHEVPPPKPTFLQSFWARNKGPALVALSQLFGALMNLAARLLELEGNGMHPVQVLLIRQSMTSLCCFIYMWWMKTPGGPFGGREILLLLVIRGVSGFFGIYG